MYPSIFTRYMSPCSETSVVRDKRLCHLVLSSMLGVISLKSLVFCFTEAYPFRSFETASSSALHLSAKASTVRLSSCNTPGITAFLICASEPLSRSVCDNISSEAIAAQPGATSWLSHQTSVENGSATIFEDGIGSPHC